MTGDEPGSHAGSRLSGLFAGKLWFWLPILPLVALDLWSKARVFRLVAEHGQPRLVGLDRRSWPVLPRDGWLKFDLVAWTNTGTVWGLGQELHGALVVLRFLALPLVIYFARRTAKEHKLQQLMLGLIMAGAIGNLYDNLSQAGGGVRDFLKFYLNEHWVFPAFNVADSCICVGAFALALLIWRQAPPARRSA